MKERPILFQGEMVRALLAGTKTQTRRVCKRAQLWAHSGLLTSIDPSGELRKAAISEKSRAGFHADVRHHVNGTCFIKNIGLAAPIAAERKEAARVLVDLVVVVYLSNFIRRKKND